MSSQILNIRRMQETDIPVVLKIEEECNPSPWKHQNFSYELLNNQVSYLWVADIEDIIVGYIASWLVVDEVQIANMAVTQKHRQKQIATKMLCKAIGYLVGKGAVTSTLEVRKSNKGAQALYRKFGYQQVGKRPRYYQDNGEDAILLTLRHLDIDYLNNIGCNKI